MIPGTFVKRTFPPTSAGDVIPGTFEGDRSIKNAINKLTGGSAEKERRRAGISEKS